MDLVDGLNRFSQAPEHWFPLGLFYPLPLGLRGKRRMIAGWPINTDQLSQVIRRSDRLVLASVQLGSPGFWEFLGS